MKFALGNRTIEISLGSETMLTLLLCTAWASMMLIYSQGFIKRMPLIGEFPEQTVIVSVSILALLALPAIVKRLCLADYLFYLANALYYVGSYALYPENEPYLTEFAFSSLACVYTFYFIGRLTDIDRMFTILTLTSTLFILANLFYYLVYLPGHTNMAADVNEDNMFAAYQSLPHVVLMLWATLSRFRIWKAVIFFLGIMFLLSCGTRGPFVCLGCFGIIYFFFYMNFKGAIYVKTGIILSALLLLLNLRDIIFHLAKTLTGLNLSTRILEKIVTGELSNDSYRSVLREQIYRVLDSDGHFFGLGPFGCKNYGVIYPHFLPLDFFSTYGYLIGSFLLVALFVLIAWAFYVARSKNIRLFILLLFCCSILKLLLSNTFLQEPYFYMLIGCCAGEVIHWYAKYANDSSRTGANLPATEE